VITEKSLKKGNKILIMSKESPYFVSAFRILHRIFGHRRAMEKWDLLRLRYRCPPYWLAKPAVQQLD
jgi:hypothetical protein